MKTIPLLTLLTLLSATSLHAIDAVALAGEKRAKVAFHKLDTDHNESLSYEEFSSCDLLADQKKSEVKQLFREFDSKRDDKITLAEFVSGVKEERREHLGHLVPRGWRFFRR